MNLRALALIVAVVAAALPAPCLGQPTINPKALPPWISEKEAAALAASAKKEIRAYAGSRHAERKAALEAVDDAAAAFRKKLGELPKFSQDYKSVVSTMEKISTSVSADRVDAVKTAWANVGAKMHDDIRRFAGDPTKLGESILSGLRKQDATYQRAQDQILGFIGMRSPTPAKKSTADTIFKPPFGVHDTGTLKERSTSPLDGLSPMMEATATISKTDATMTLHAYAGDGGHASSSATIGCFVEVPSGKLSMTIRILYDYSYSVAAWAAGANESRATAQGLVSVFQIGTADLSQVRQADLFPPVSVTSVLGVTVAQPTGNLYLEFSPVTVSAGKRYFIAFTADADTLGARQSYANSDMTVTPRAMEITFR